MHIQIEHPLSKILVTRSASHLGVFQMLEYMHWLYPLSSPHLKIQNLKWSKIQNFYYEKNLSGSKQAIYAEDFAASIQE